LPNGSSWEGTRWKDTPATRREAEVLAARITEEMTSGIFDYLEHFPNGNKAELFRQQRGKTEPKTIRQYYDIWKADKIPPFVKRTREQKYRSHFVAHILPIHGEKYMQAYGMAEIREIRARLIDERHLSVKTAKNVLNASLRALFRDAKAEGVIPRNPFDDLPSKWWPKGVDRPPDPFTEAERDEIIRHFDQKHRGTWAMGCAFMSALFWTGCRPSELTARRWRDYDPRTGCLTIASSRTLGEEGAPKTSGSNRTIPLLGPARARIEEIRQLRAGPNDYIFMNKEGRPIDQAEFAKRHFWPALTVLKIRHRPFYNTRHTFISVCLSHGEHIKQIADYCGTSMAMIEKSYGKWLGGFASFGQALGERDPSETASLTSRKG